MTAMQRRLSLAVSVLRAALWVGCAACGGAPAGRDGSVIDMAVGDASTPDAGVAPGPRWPRIGMYPIGGSPRAYDRTDFLDLAAKHEVVILGIWNGWEADRTRTFAQCVDYIHAHSTVGTKVFAYHNDYDVAADDATPGSADHDVYEKLVAENWWGYVAGTSGAIAPSGFGSASIGNISRFAPPDAAGQTYMQWTVRRHDGIVHSGGSFGGNANGGAPTLDGIFHDLCYYEARSDWDYDRDGVTEPRASPASRAEIQRMFHEQIAYYRSVFPGAIQIGNTSDYGDTSRDPAAWRGVLQGGVLEGLIGETWSPETWSGFETMKASYALQMSLYTTPSYAVFGYFAGTSSDPDAWPPSGWTAAQWQSFRYGFASSQVLGDASFYCAVNGGYDNAHVVWADDYDDGGAGLQWLGAATNGPQTAAWSRGVYRRDFEHGIVLVNPKANGAQTVDLGGTFHHIAGRAGLSDTALYDGAAVTSVTLQDRDGIALVR